MMGKSASFVCVDVEGKIGAETTDLIADMGRKLAMHVVRTHALF